MKVLLIVNGVLALVAVGAVLGIAVAIKVNELIERDRHDTSNKVWP